MNKDGFSNDVQAAEFRKYRVPGLLEEYSEQGLEVHHISMEDGCVPGFSVLLEAVFRVQEVEYKIPNGVTFEFLNRQGRWCWGSSPSPLLWWSGPHLPCGCLLSSWP